MTNKCTLFIENLQDTLQGYLEFPSKNSTHTQEDEKTIIPLHSNAFNFNPLTILGDLKIVIKDIAFNNNLKMSTEKSFLFNAPYDTEDCIPILNKTSNNFKYFCLLEEIQKIIKYNKKFTISDLNLLGQYCQIPINFSLTVFEKSENAKNELKSGKSFTYGLCSFDEMYDNKKSDSHIFICQCSSITDIVFYILYYLILFDYHFYQCKHCKRYSATKKRQGINKYCSRENILQLDAYNAKTCKEAVEMLLDNLRTRKKTYYDHLYAKYGANDQTNNFIEGYNELYKKVKIDPSPENLIKLKEFLDGYSPKRQKDN